MQTRDVEKRWVQNSLYLGSPPPSALVSHSFTWDPFQISPFYSTLSVHLRTYFSNALMHIITNPQSHSVAFALSWFHGGGNWVRGLSKLAQGHEGNTCESQDLKTGLSDFKVWALSSSQRRPQVGWPFQLLGSKEEGYKFRRQLDGKLLNCCSLRDLSWKWSFTCTALPSGTFLNHRVCVSRDGLCWDAWNQVLEFKCLLNEC